MPVIGISGRIGSGKSEVCRFFEERFSAQRLRFSDILRDILDRLYLPVERQNFQKLGKALREAFGDEIVARPMKEDIARLGDGAIVVDGVRYRSEADMIRDFEDGYIIFVKAGSGTRYRRSLARAERGEGEMSYQDFLNSERAETERHLGEVEGTADFIVKNEGSLEDLFDQLEEISDEIFRKKNI